MRGIPPHPKNYCLWASFVSRDNPTLAKELSEIIASGVAFTDAKSDELFDKHFSHLNLSDDILAVGGKMQKELNTVVASLQAAGENTQAYGLALEGASGQLVEASDPTALRQMVDALAAATRQMQHQSQALEARLKETTNEVDQLRASLEKVREEALTDALTGIANRKHFEESLNACVETAHARGEPLSLVMADIDHFKNFNDTWGHPTGDQIIRFVAHTLGRLAPEPNVAARYGGEEFALLGPGMTLADARAVAEEIRQSVERKKLLRKSTNEDLGKITISMGVAQLTPGEDPWAFVERADKSLYASKLNGRNQITVDEGGELAA